LRPGMESLSLNAPPGFADVAPLPMVGRGLARSEHSSSASSSTPHPAAAQAGQATVAREAEPGPGATPKIRGAAASVGSSSGSGRGGAAGPEGRRGGVTPSVSGRSGRGSDFISDVIFGGYSKDNKKEFKSYMTTDTRQEGLNYARGEDGEKWPRADIVSNSFPLEAKIGDIELVQYHVSFEPVQDATRKRIRLLDDNIEQFFDQPAQRHMIFDGAVLFLPATVRLNEGRKDVTRKIFDSDDPLRMTIKQTANLDTSSPTVKQILNRIFRDAQGATGSVQIGRHYFNHQEPIKVEKYSIDIWPGFSTRIDQYDGGIMVTMDAISKVMKNKNVLELMHDWFKDLRNNNEAIRSKAEKEIIGETVLTKYNNKNYKIDGIEWGSSPLSEFTKSDGSTITYQEYYKNNYNLPVDDNQPLLIHRPKPKEQRMRDLQGLKGEILLIPQLCHLTGLGTMRQDMSTMREIAKITRFTPDQRQRHSTTFIRRIQETPGAIRELDKLNLRFGQELVKVEDARVMPQTEIKQGGMPLRYRRDQADWSRALADSRFNSGAPLSKWHVVMPKRDEAAVRKFVQELISVGRRVSMDVQPPSYLPMDQSAARDYIGCIRGIPDDTELVFCVLPDDKKDRYDAIKQLTSCEKPTPSQLILAKTCKKENILRSVATKVLLQMNCKLGGSPWDAHLPFKKDGVIMIVGVDTFVDPKATRTTGKVNGALIASYDQQATKWFSRPLLQSADTVVEGLKLSFEQALRNYKNHNGKLPDRVVVYRDGVGDGQLENVQRDEVRAFMDACRRCDPAYQDRVKLTVCVVTKRVPIRFFLRRGGNYVNPEPGTLVDSTVTKHVSEMIDFYIVSQSTNQGTVSPTHYNLIHDSSGWNLDRHQLLAYKLCHLYYNWAGAIRVPAPCQYAHKLAFMVNENLHKSPDEKLREQLWYL